MDMKKIEHYLINKSIDMIVRCRIVSARLLEDEKGMGMVEIAIIIIIIIALGITFKEKINELLAGIFAEMEYGELIN